MKAIILAAGKGKRMKSSLQKVLHPILGKTVVEHAVAAAIEAGAAEGDITVVVGADGDQIKSILAKAHPALNFAIQDPPKGTGHAAECGMGKIDDADDVVILCGDTPLITGAFLKELASFFHGQKAEAVVAAAYNQNPGDLGRVYATEGGDFIEIIEAKDLAPDAAHTDFINTGIYMFKGHALRAALGKVTNNNNNQGEYYITDVPKIIKESGGIVKALKTHESMATFSGINTQVQLAEAAAHMRQRINQRHMENGVRMLDPATVYIDATVKISQDTVIYPGAVIEGKSTIEEGAIVGPGTHMKDTTLGKCAHIRQSVTDGAKIGAHSTVGPFAYLRPGTAIGEHCRVGNFVEIKNATLGNDTKMAHLAYIGDADVGNNVNYSCGAITANYDGKNKFRTTIKDGAFIGSNANLVAPLTIGEGAFVAAGSTITKDLPDGALGIGRARQEERANWKRP
ncbi:MAG: bifunctional UDP-N-acetylglucosamine diphosphorylase/glucosamine-1-phosphate N-acetyltransferase GlmU [Defluviitaleaceae bacterium]|nr:bifunctional UDP-N-acetylglucosamine diphosphorylase/glucosamine-1-phosphate N-acetyltransferase GlmU [Defluviitaleaceae bacterium]